MSRLALVLAAVSLLLGACDSAGNDSADVTAPTEVAAPRDSVETAADSGYIHVFSSEGLTATLNTEAGTLRLETEAQLLAEIQASSFGVRRAEATYETQFGMFNIQERATEDWQEGASFALVEEPAEAFPQAVGGDKADYTEPTLFFHVRDARGEPFLLGGVQVRRPGTAVLMASALDETRNRVRLAYDCQADEHFAGFGAQSHDVDHRGQIVPLWVSEQGIGKRDDDELPGLWFVEGRRHTTHIPVGAAVSSRGTAWHLDTSAYATVDLCASAPERIGVEVWAKFFNVQFHAGPTPLDALSQMTRVVGRPRMPPPWAFAPWNDTFGGSEEVRDFAAFLRENELPSSALWCEDWRGGGWVAEGYRISLDWGLSREIYPDFEELLAELREDGFFFQTYFNTFVYQNSDVWDEALAEGYVIMREDGEPYVVQGPASGFPNTAIADLTNPETWDWVKAHLVQAFAYGVRGWMADYAEWQPVDGVVLADGADPALSHNGYPRLWQRVNQAAVAEAGVADEACIFHRSAYNYGQDQAHIIWAGDQRTSFDTDDGLPTIVPIGLGLAATGFPFYAHDVSGYQSATNPPATKELFFRWTELSAWSPVMRTHHGIAVQENWNLRRDEETTAMWRHYAGLHVRLYPYWRALAKQAVDDGRPLWRPLGFHHPDDEAAWPVLDAFYVGEAVLVAPVVSEGATERAVYLPAGRYTPFPAGGEVFEGPTTVTVPAAMDEIPVFLAAGGLLPLTPEPAQTLLPDVADLAGLESTEGDRVLYVGLGADGELEEESGARYRLEGAGTALGALTPDAGGAIEILGNGTLEGDDFTLTLAGHPETRRTRVFLR